jgi:Ni,Fe-hydrogenase III large subunit
LTDAAKRTGANIMESPQKNQLLEQQTQKVVQELEGMRDRLTNLSLMLNDLKFELNLLQHQVATEKSAPGTEQNQSRQP